VNQIATEKGIEPEKVLGAIESAIAAAYKKEYRKKTEVVRARFDMETGKTKFFQVKTVVLPEHVRIVEEGEEENAPLAEEEEHEFPRYNADRHLFLEEAKKNKIRCDGGRGNRISARSA
jgi:hypothetical protein